MAYRGGGRVEHLPPTPFPHQYATALAHFLVQAFLVLKKHLTRYGTEPMTWGSVVVMETRLWTRQSRVRILAGARGFCFLQNVQNGSGAQPASYSVGTRVISWRYCGQGTLLTTRLRLALRLRMSRAVRVLSLRATDRHNLFKPSSVCFRSVDLKGIEPSYAAVICIL